MRGEELGTVTLVNCFREFCYKLECRYGTITREVCGVTGGFFFRQRKQNDPVMREKLMLLESEGRSARVMPMRG